MTDRHGGGIAPISVPKAADILAAQLRRMIVEGVVPPGSYLPNERTLVAESGLSRTSVRDALRILEAEGLISTKVGRTGGSMVTRPQRDLLARSLELFVRTHDIRLDALLECRVAIEPTLARLAARDRTPAQLAEMEALHLRFAASGEDVAEYKVVNLEWHLAIARASGNEPLIALMEAVAEPVRDAMDYANVTTPERRAVAIQAHARILEAIREQDEAKAERRMSRHVIAYRDIAIDEAARHPRQAGGGSVTRAASPHRH